MVSWGRGAALEGFVAAAPRSRERLVKEARTGVPAKCPGRQRGEMSEIVVAWRKSLHPHWGCFPSGRVMT